MIDLCKKYYLDGAMGSELIKRGLIGVSESFNLTNPEVVREIHSDYIDSGANIIYTNTFGVNPFKYNDEQMELLINEGVKIARECSSKPHFVALDIGSMGKIIGQGGCTFDDIYNAYKKIVLIAKDKTDLIVVETINDLVECRIALLAVKENSSLPVICSMSFESNGKTVFGNPIRAFALICETLGADALALNCGLSAEEMLLLSKELINCTSLPIFLKPNAGQPEVVDGVTVYRETPQNYAKYMTEAFKLGVNGIGGCCGTNPSFIKELALISQDVSVGKREEINLNFVCSPYECKSVNQFCLIGERINPTGKKLMQQALLKDDLAYILSLAVAQEDAGADVLDVNVGMNGIDEKKAMNGLLEELATVTNLPLMIDTSDYEVVEMALRKYSGRAILNSVNGKDEVLEKILPLVKKYGAMVVGLTLDQNGIPETYEQKVTIAKKIIDRCESFGIDKNCIIIDCLTMSEASKAGNAINTLNALKEVKKLGVKTVLGVSNISFGMPKREIINKTFLELAKENGLDMAIINPALLKVNSDQKAKNFLLAKPNSVQEYIDYASEITVETSLGTHTTLDRAIITGQKHLALQIAKEKIENAETNLVNDYIIPALDIVGAKFEKGEMFLPQLISSAEAAKGVIEYMQSSEKVEIQSNGHVFIIATVYGDVHDIGKNIVKAVVSNYGFEVIDLGKDVKSEIIIEKAKQYPNATVGLSALMTTTVKNMEETVKKLSEFGVKTLVGGAVLTEEYAQSFGGIYCKDASDTVKKLKAIYHI